MKKKFCICLILFIFVLYPLSANAAEPYQIIGSNCYCPDPIDTIYVNVGPSEKDNNRYASIKNKNLSFNINFFEFDKIIAQAAKKHNVNFLLIKAIIKVESNFNPGAISGKGAKGLMQIMPSNYDSLDINNPFDPTENIMGGTKYLKLLLIKFGKLELALAAYNAGPNETIKYEGIPPFSETKIYVKKVKKLYNIFTLSEKLSIESKRTKGGVK